MTTLVVPSIREEHLKRFLNAWEDGGFDQIIVVEDNPKTTFKVGGVELYSWEDIKRDLGWDEWIISRRNSAIRSYGFYKAWLSGADLIITLDDDCLPVFGFPVGYLTRIYERELNRTTATEWFNTVRGIYPRGFPYGIRDKEVALCHGLWLKNPDLDAPTALIKGSAADYVPVPATVPKGSYFPMCGMNLAFRPKFTPLMYFGLQGMKLGKEKLPYDRFDDIWCGVIAKKVIDHLDKAVVTGTPLVEHSRASNTMTNLVKEAPGIKVNEDFWKLIDAIELNGYDPVSCMDEVGQALEKGKGYFKEYGKAIRLWTGLFQ